MLIGAILVFGLLGLGVCILAVRALRLRKFTSGIIATLLGLLLISICALLTTIRVAVQGYRALTREEVAARVTVLPIGEQQFESRFTFPDGRDTTFLLAGDQLYVDAHILKWKPVANFLGLHTAYELDRVGGRYVELESERDRERTLFSLKPERSLDMFTLRQRYRFLSPLLDAEYGSATFIGADTARTLEVRVSTTGLLVRVLPR